MPSTRPAIMREMILAGWRGNTTLAKAFWGYFVFGQFLMAAAILILLSPALLFGETVFESVKLITYPLYYAFLVWAMVSIWRCSPNTKYRAFSVASRLFVALYSLLWVVAILQQSP